MEGCGQKWAGMHCQPRRVWIENWGDVDAGERCGWISSRTFWFSLFDIAVYMLYNNSSFNINTLFFLVKWCVSQTLPNLTRFCCLLHPIPELIPSMIPTQWGSSKVGRENIFNKLFSNFKIRKKWLFDFRLNQNVSEPNVRHTISRIKMYALYLMPPLFLGHSLLLKFLVSVVPSTSFPITLTSNAL